MDNVISLESFFELNRATKIAIGNSLDQYDSFCLYCQFPEKEVPRKELSKRQIKANEKEERKPFLLNLIIYDSSKILFESEHDVHVDRDCTIDQITRMCFNDEVATKIHVRH